MIFQPELGVSLHTVSDELTDQALAAVGSSRIATLEISPALLEGDQQPRKRPLMAMLQRSGIRPASVHAKFGAPFDVSSPDEETRRTGIAAAGSAVELAAELGAAIVVCHASAEPIAPPDRAEHLRRAQDALAEIAPRCRRAGVRIAVELLPRTCIGNTVEELGELLAPLDEQTFGVCLDTNHLMGRHAQLADKVRRLGQRLITLHLSDYDGVDEKHQLPGTGVLDWPSFVAALGEIGYAGPFNYECTLPGPTPAERVTALEESFAWLSGL